MKHNYKFLIFFAILYHIIVLVTIAKTYKIVQVGNFITNGGLLIYPLTLTIADLVAEVYGYHYAKKIIRSSLIYDNIFALGIILILQFFLASDGYQKTFEYLLRLAFAGVLFLFINGFINKYLINGKILLKGKYFCLRSVISTAIGPIALNSIIILIVFSGIESLSQILKLSFFVYICLLIYTFLTATPLILIIRLIKYLEGIDVSEYNFDSNLLRSTE